MNPSPAKLAAGFALIFALAFALIAMGAGDNWPIPLTVCVCFTVYGVALIDQDDERK